MSRGANPVDLEERASFFKALGHPTRLLLLNLLTLSPTRLEDAVEPDAYRQKVCRAFFRHGRLTRLPAQLKKWKVVLEKIVESFDTEREYTEKAVNVILLDFHDDVATLRRGLIEHKLMTRSAGICRRVVVTD